jgi:hypothetical protein
MDGWMIGLLILVTILKYSVTVPCPPCPPLYAGEFIRQSGQQVQVATKYAPQPWRLNAESVPIALKASLARLQLPKVELYMQHWCGGGLNVE